MAKKRSGDAVNIRSVVAQLGAESYRRILYFMLSSVRLMTETRARRADISFLGSCLYG
jgi:hypothetical protein